MPDLLLLQDFEYGVRPTGPLQVCRLSAGAYVRVRELCLLVVVLEGHERKEAYADTFTTYQHPNKFNFRLGGYWVCV